MCGLTREGAQPKQHFSYGTTRLGRNPKFPFIVKVSYSSYFVKRHTKCAKLLSLQTTYLRGSLNSPLTNIMKLEQAKLSI